jgi:ubiquitin carboxyl-terminal hydrolase 7
VVEDLIQVLVKKAQIPDEVEGGRIRVFEVNNHKFSRELTRDYNVISMSDYTTFYAERTPEEELNVDDNNFISVFHFQNEPNRVHGVPFKFLLIEVRISSWVAVKA